MSSARTNKGFGGGEQVARDRMGHREGVRDNERALRAGEGRGEVGVETVERVLSYR